MKIITWLKSLSDEWKIGCLLVFFTFLIYLSFSFTKNHFEYLSQETFIYLDRANEKNLSLLASHPSDDLSSEQIALLNKKIQVAEDYKEHHKDLAGKLYKNNYALYTIFPLLSAITAILTFLLVQKGWSSSGIYLKSLFAFFTATTALTGIYPEVYKQAEGISSNLEAYGRYKTIQKSMFNYALTGPEINGDSIEFDQFIDSMNYLEMKLHKIHFGLEKKAIDKTIFENM